MPDGLYMFFYSYLPLWLTVLSHVNPTVALLRVLTPCPASREAVKDYVVKCKSPFVLQFQWEFPQNVRLRTVLLSTLSCAVMLSEELNKVYLCILL